MNNRQKLLECALDLFSRRGYDAVGVSEIVTAAGVTKPTLYHYFDSKHGLLEAIIHEEENYLLQELGRKAMYQGDLVLNIENIARFYFELAQRSGDFYRLQLAMYFAPPESEANRAIQPFAREQHKILENLFIQAVEDHGNLRNRQRRYAAGFLGSINAMIGLYLNCQLELSDELLYQMVHQFMYGIFS